MEREDMKSIADALQEVQGRRATKVLEDLSNFITKAIIEK